MSNEKQFFEVEIIENSKYYNILTPHKKDSEVENFPKHDSVIKIWLRKKPREGYFVSALERVSPFKIEESNGQDRGHLIARMFKKYLLTESELKNNNKKVYNFFGVGNGENIRLQNPLSNRNSKEYRGQLFYEQKIQIFLDKLKGEEVYFEIAEGEFDLIIKENNKKVTKLGRRIYINFVEPKEDSIHVFIPENRTQLSSSDH